MIMINNAQNLEDLKIPPFNHQIGDIPVSRIQDILHDRRKITADTSLRLAKFFGVSDKYFLDIQNDIDIRNTKKQIMDEINNIPLYQYAQIG